jgi:hypothetical protein
MSLFSENWNTIQYLIPIFYILVVCAVSIIFSKNISNNADKKKDGTKARDRHDISEA